MKAAVVSRFDRPPRFADVAIPTPSSEHEVVVEVLAAGLHPRVRSQANGAHYTSTDELPLVPASTASVVGQCPGWAQRTRCSWARTESVGQPRTSTW